MPKYTPPLMVTPRLTVGPPGTAGSRGYWGLKSAAMRASTWASFTLALTEGTWSLRLECIWVPRTLTRKQAMPREATAMYDQGVCMPVASPTSTASAACSGRSATLRSSPGGAGLGIATSSRANSMSSRSRAARAFRTCCSRAECAGLDGGVRLLVRGSAGVFDPVAAGPPHSLPGFQLGGFDLEEPARLFHGRLQVGRAVLAEVAVAHAGCDRDPFAADVGALHQLGLAAAQHLAEVLRLLDDKVDAGIVGEVLGPARVLAWDEPEVAVSPFVPADGDVGVAVRREAGQVHVDPAAQEILDLLRRH